MSGQFGSDAERVTTEERQAVFDELDKKLGGAFCKFELTRTVKKIDHGDTDILVLTHPNQSARQAVERHIDAADLLKIVRNGYCHSILYRTEAGKQVHVDLLVSGDPAAHRTKVQYYAFNDLGAAVGVLARRLNFKYGSEGFFKRHEDRRGNWHDIPVSTNLDVGLRVLGLEPDPQIETRDDIVTYVSKSPFFDSNMYAGFEGNRWEVLEKLGSLGKAATLTDPDHFFMELETYGLVRDRMKEIDATVYRQSRFNGTWLMDNFHVPAGPGIGKMLKKIGDRFGDRLGEVSEAEVADFVKGELDVEAGVAEEIERKN